MKLKIQAKHLGKIIQEQSPLILTALGVAGTVGTALFVGKATFLASEKIHEESHVWDEKDPGISRGLTNKEKALKVWKLYIPAVGVGALTITCIVAANRIQTRRLAAIVAGYAVLSGDFDDYREKASEMLGGKKSGELDSKRAMTKFEQQGRPHGILTGQQSWFMDESTGRVFPSTMETVKHAQNNLNYKLNNQGSVSLNHFYEELDLETTTLGDMLGWHPGEKIEIVPTSFLTEEYGAVTQFHFAPGSVPKYWAPK